MAEKELLLEEFLGSYVLAKNVSYFHYVEIPQILRKYNCERELRDFFEHFISKIRVDGDILYNGEIYSSASVLYVLSSFVQNSFVKKKQLIKLIRQILLHLEQHLDERYMLFVSSQDKIIFARDQIYFVKAFSYIEEFLQENDFFNEYERLSKLNDMVDLGMRRYLLQSTTMVSKLVQNQEVFIFTQEKELLEFLWIAGGYFYEEFDIRNFLHSFTVSNLYETFLFYDLLKREFPKKKISLIKEINFVLGGADTIISKKEFTHFSKTFSSLFLKEPEKITVKGDSRVGISTGNRLEILLSILGGDIL